MNDKGLYCERGGFYIDPWRPVELAIITHAHADHARGGSKKYVCSPGTAAILRHRIAADIECLEIPFGEKYVFGDIEISLHPAGHILGSSQVRLHDGVETWVVTGDYKRAFDPSCEAFEVVPCDTLITESTFGLPIYRWRPGKETAQEILSWVNGFEGTSVLYCYSLGKTQRVLAELEPFLKGPVYLHGAAEEITKIYRQAGVKMPEVRPASEITKDILLPKTLVIAPPSAHRSAWMKRFKHFQTGFASGWMRIRGNKRRRNVEQGFVLSDHADWDELVQTVKDCGAKRILVTHGNNDVFSKFLKTEMHLDASQLETQYEDKTEGE